MADDVMQVVPEPRQLTEAAQSPARDKASDGEGFNAGCLHVCDHCGKKLSSASKLVEHIRLHTGEKPFKCHLCNFATPRRNDLTQHVRDHTGGRPFRCSICDYATKTRRQLLVHYFSHGQPGQAAFHCPDCGVPFLRRASLTWHMQTCSVDKGPRFQSSTTTKASESSRPPISDELMTSRDRTESANQQRAPGVLEITVPRPTRPVRPPPVESPLQGAAPVQGSLNAGFPTCSTEGNRATIFGTEVASSTETFLHMAPVVRSGSAYPNLVSPTIPGLQAASPPVHYHQPAPAHTLTDPVLLPPPLTRGHVPSGYPSGQSSGYQVGFSIPLQHPGHLARHSVWFPPRMDNLPGTRAPGLCIPPYPPPLRLATSPPLGRAPPAAAVLPSMGTGCSRTPQPPAFGQLHHVMGRPGLPAASVPFPNISPHHPWSTPPDLYPGMFGSGIPHQHAPLPSPPLYVSARAAMARPTREPSWTQFSGPPQWSAHNYNRFDQAAPLEVSPSYPTMSSFNRPGPPPMHDHSARSRPHSTNMVATTTVWTTEKRPLSFFESPARKQRFASVTLDVTPDLISEPSLQESTTSVSRHDPTKVRSDHASSPDIHLSEPTAPDRDLVKAEDGSNSAKTFGVPDTLGDEDFTMPEQEHLENPIDIAAEAEKDGWGVKHEAEDEMSESISAVNLMMEGSDRCKRPESESIIRNRLLLGAITLPPRFRSSSGSTTNTDGGQPLMHRSHTPVTSSSKIRRISAETGSTGELSSESHVAAAATGWDMLSQGRSALPPTSSPSHTVTSPYVPKSGADATTFLHPLPAASTPSRRLSFEGRSTQTRTRNGRPASAPLNTTKTGQSKHRIRLKGRKFGHASYVAIPKRPFSAPPKSGFPANPFPEFSESECIADPNVANATHSRNLAFVHRSHGPAKNCAGSGALATKRSTTSWKPGVAFERQAASGHAKSSPKSIALSIDSPPACDQRRTTIERDVEHRTQADWLLSPGTISDHANSSTADRETGIAGDPSELTDTETLTSSIAPILPSYLEPRSPLSPPLFVRIDGKRLHLRDYTVLHTFLHNYGPNIHDTDQIATITGLNPHRVEEFYSKARMHLLMDLSKSNAPSGDLNSLFLSRLIQGRCTCEGDHCFVDFASTVSQRLQPRDRNGLAALFAKLGIRNFVRESELCASDCQPSTNVGHFFGHPDSGSGSGHETQGTSASAQ